MPRTKNSLRCNSVDGDVNDALTVIRKTYYDEVRTWASDFDKRIAEGEWEDREDFIEAFDQEIDGSQRVIYTFQARLGLLASDNEDAGIEELGPESFDWSAGIPYSQLMFFAFRQDIIDAMESDIDDDETFEDDDETFEEEDDDEE